MSAQDTIPRALFVTDRGVAALNGAPSVRKEDAPCCHAARDDLGRLPIGFCGPDCERRKLRDTAARRARHPGAAPRRSR